MAKQFRLLTKEDETLLFGWLDQGLSMLKENLDFDNLSPEEKTSLIHCCAANQILISTNLRLVFSIVKRHASIQSPAFPDILQEGVLGLMEAVSRFDIARNHKFSTYARWWIRQKVTRYIANSSRTIRLPVHMHEKWRVINIAQEFLRSSLQREPSIDEMSAETGLSVKEIQQIQISGPLHLESLNKPMVDGSDTELGEIMEDKRPATELDNLTTDLSLNTIIDTLFNTDTLTTREKQILSLRYGIERQELFGTLIHGRSYERIIPISLHKGSLTLDELSAIFGVSRERIRQIESQVFTKLVDQKGDTVVALLQSMS